ncbi:MAG TPA: hypothetical protein VES20_05695, partial [Bryobacteraceae bacterium]|nr:hypothetical protein [Bryobacteraceae bacterium]
MGSALLVRLRPAGPWRLGPDDGSRSRSDTTLHSDTLYSALTVAMHDLGQGAEWLDATAGDGPAAVRLSSGFPFGGQLTFVPPPRTVWPP